MSVAPIRVVKVGGSLFDWPELRTSLARWLARQSPAHHVFIAGGGPLVRSLAVLQTAQGLSDETLHWLAVDALEVSTNFLHALLPRQTEHAASWAGFLARLARASAPQCFMLHVGEFLREIDARSSAPLPENWSITSDSIAARVAANLAAAELVILKSCLPEPFSQLADLSASGYVDSYFSVAAAEVPRVRFVQLRGECLPERVWTAE